MLRQRQPEWERELRRALSPLALDLCLDHRISYHAYEAFLRVDLRTWVP